MRYVVIYPLTKAKDMQFLKRSLVGIFLLALTLALFAWAGNTVRLAINERMNAEPRSFPQRERVLSVNVVAVAPETIAPELAVFGELKSSNTFALRAPFHFFRRYFRLLL